MNKSTAAKLIAEGLRDTYTKMDALEDLTGFGVYDYLDGLYTIEIVLLNILDVPPWEGDKDIVSDFLHSRIDYEEMLAKIEVAKANFDPDAYDEFVKEYVEAYGNHPNGGGSAE